MILLLTFNLQKPRSIKITLKITQNLVNQFSSIPAGSINQMFQDVGLSESTTTHQVLEKSKGFSCQNVLSELMYDYITYRSDIRYTITTLSKFLSGASVYRYKMLRGDAKYLHLP